MAVQIARWQFTVSDYARMREIGILTEDDRVELIDGEVRPMTPIGPQHAAIVNRLNRLLAQQLGAPAIVSVQNPIQLDDHSEPQPDLAVLRSRADFYAQALPRPTDVLLLIEVADSTAAYDRNEKVPRYAAAGIPEVWLVDIAGLTLEQYTQPRNGRYYTQRVLERGESAQADGVALAVAVEQLFA
ncbi:MAG TPA: Uma2 family endonuclease [Roseiflexaceae bacterium]|nr:Uma2 family endonuclease [Roseiflexaceae bacterium]